jgi:hypothetical protein
MKDVIQSGLLVRAQFFIRVFVVKCKQKKKNVNQVLSELTGNPYRDPIWFTSISSSDPGPNISSKGLGSAPDQKTSQRRRWDGVPVS